LPRRRRQRHGDPTGSRQPHGDGGERLADRRRLRHLRAEEMAERDREGIGGVFGEIVRDAGAALPRARGDGS